MKQTWDLFSKYDVVVSPRENTSVTNITGTPSIVVPTGFAIPQPGRAAVAVVVHRPRRGWTAAGGDTTRCGCTTGSAAGHGSAADRHVHHGSDLPGREEPARRPRIPAGDGLPQKASSAVCIVAPATRTPNPWANGGVLSLPPSVTKPLQRRRNTYHACVSNGLNAGTKPTVDRIPVVTVWASRRTTRRPGLRSNVRVTTSTGSGFSATSLRQLRSLSRMTPPAADALAQTGEYSIFGLTRAEDQTVIRERQIGFTLLLFGVATVIALLYSVERYFYSRLVGDPVSLTQLVPAELIFTYAWALLTPLVMYRRQALPGLGTPHLRNGSVSSSARWSRSSSSTSRIFSLVTVALEPRPALPRRCAEAVRPVAALVDGRSMRSSSARSSSCTTPSSTTACRKDRALRASQLEARLAQTQLQMLRMQLQPHFLFNTLHSISALMHKDVRRADSMIAALSDLLRMSLQNIGAQEVPLQSELDFLQRYVEIMSLRFGDRLRVTIDVDPETRDARVPNLFLQPLVENSFRHGFGDLGQGSIAISVRRDGDMLRCDVVDDGRGPPRRTQGRRRARRARASDSRTSTATDTIFSLRGAPGEGVHVTMAIPFHPYERAAAD